MSQRSIKFLSFTCAALLPLGISTPLVSSEPAPQQCERKDPNDPNSEEICIPLPSVPAPSPQPQPAPGGSSETPEEPGHEAWESPNAGADDTSSGKPEKDPKPSSSKKPSAASSADSEGSSSGGGKRPDTVCGGQFCGEGDTLIGGVGRVEQPGANQVPTSPTDSVNVVRPADETTPADRVGTVVQTADGLAVHTSDGVVVAVDPAQADRFVPVDSVEIRRPEPAQSNQNRPGKNDDDSDSNEQTQAAAYTPEEVAPMLLVGVIGGMMGLLLPESQRRRRPRVTVPVSRDEGTHRAFVTKENPAARPGNPPLNQGEIPPGYVASDHEQDWDPGDPVPDTVLPGGVWVYYPAMPGLVGAGMVDPPKGRIVEFIPSETADSLHLGFVGIPSGSTIPDLTLSDLPPFEPSPPAYGEENTNRPPVPSSSGQASVLQVEGMSIAAEMGRRFGPMSQDRYLRYLHGDGSDYPLTQDETQKIIDQEDHWHSPSTEDTISPYQYTEDYTDRMKHSDEVRQSAAQAKNNHEPVVGYYEEPWYSNVTSGNTDHYHALGTFSMAGSTRYIVHPPDENGVQDIEYETVYFVYDWYDFDFDWSQDAYEGDFFAQTAVNASSQLHGMGYAQEYATIGTSSPQRDTSTVPVVAADTVPAN